MASSANAGFQGLIETLARHGVEFIVVGGVGASLHGAPISTIDLDVVYRRTDANVERMLGALQALGAIYRDPAGGTIKPDAKKLNSHRIHLLRTRLRPLDLLYAIGAEETYQDLLPKSKMLRLGSVECHVLNLATVIESKRIANRDKDRAVLAILEATHRLQESEEGN